MYPLRPRGKVVADTQMHSLASDGALWPAELVNKAKEVGLQIIALTDHETTHGLPEAMSEAKAAGISLIPGVEIDAWYECEFGRVDLELLGLNVDIKRIQPFLEKRLFQRK